MGGFIRRDVQRAETIALSQNINKKLLDGFKDYCKELGYPLNVVIEIFMQQYSNGRFDVSDEDICKWKKDDSETGMLSTTFNKEIYLSFKSVCQDNGYFIKHVLTVFMEKFISRNFILEYVDVTKVKEE